MVVNILLDFKKLICSLFLVFAVGGGGDSTLGRWGGDFSIHGTPFTSVGGREDGYAHLIDISERISRNLKSERHAQKSSQQAA